MRAMDLWVRRRGQWMTLKIFRSAGTSVQ